MHPPLRAATPTSSSTSASNRRETTKTAFVLSMVVLLLPGWTGGPGRLFTAGGGALTTLRALRHPSRADAAASATRDAIRTNRLRRLGQPPCRRHPADSGGGARRHRVGERRER